MNLGQSLQRIQSIYSRGVQSKNSRLRKRHSYSALMSARSLLLQQQYNKGQKISQWSYQVLPCVELVKAQLHECVCIPDEGCHILKTKYKLPQPITGIDKHLIQSVSSIDGTTTVYDETTLTTSKYSKNGNKYTKGYTEYYIHNDHLFLMTDKPVKAIMVVAPFGDIVEAEMFPSMCPCDTCGCQDIMEMSLHFDSDLERPLIELANLELINLFKQMKEDINSNTIDTTDTGMTHQTQQGQ